MIFFPIFGGESFGNVSPVSIVPVLKYEIFYTPETGGLNPFVVVFLFVGNTRVDDD